MVDCFLHKADEKYEKSIECLFLDVGGTLFEEKMMKDRVL